MPCNTIQLNQVKLVLHKLDDNLLKAALKNMGATQISISGEGVNRQCSFIANGYPHVIKQEFLISRSPDVEACGREIAVEYATKVVEVAAAINGWELQKTGERSFNIIRG